MVSLLLDGVDVTGAEGLDDLYQRGDTGYLWCRDLVAPHADLTSILIDGGLGNDYLMGLSSMVARFGHRYTRFIEIVHHRW